MAESKNIKNLTLSDLAGLASDIIVGSIERGEFILINIEKQIIEIAIQGVSFLLWKSQSNKAFTNFNSFNEHTEKNCLSCYLSIKEGSKAYAILSNLFIDNERAIKEKELHACRKKSFQLEKELDLSL